MRLAAAVVFAGVILSPASFAQESTARLLGAVTDPTGAGVPHTVVTAKNNATGLSCKAQTDDSGNYSIPLLPIGQYTVIGEAAGFKPATITGLTLQVSQEARVDIKLAVGSTNESIQVEATTPVLVTDNSSV